jgi:hypothetical protein
MATVPTYDLFISYSGFDRPWAKKLYDDLQANYPSIRTFWDQESIGAGVDWRKKLTASALTAKHLVVIWSEQAKASGEVVLEIGEFNADVRRNPKIELSERLSFAIGLDGMPGVSLELRQGFPGLAPFYKPEQEDRGIGAVDTTSADSAWRRMIRMIANAVANADAAEPIIAGIVCTNRSRFSVVEQLRTLAQHPNGLSLNEFLTQYQLTWEQVRARYGANALQWRPFGGTGTVVDLLEDLRMQANSKLNSRYWFRWEYMDLADQTYFKRIKELNQRPSLVVVDPISLFDYYTANVFRELEAYLQEEHSVMVSLSPVGESGSDWFSAAIRAQSNPLLDEYFEPPIPPRGGFAKCVLNVQRISELERLVRGRIGAMQVKKSIAESRNITGVGQ